LYNNSADKKKEKNNNKNNSYKKIIVLAALVGAALITAPITTAVVFANPQVMQVAQQFAAKYMTEDLRTVGDTKWTARWGIVEPVEPRTTSVFFGDCVLGEYPAAPLMMLGSSQLRVVESYVAAMPDGTASWVFAVKNNDRDEPHWAAFGANCQGDSATRYDRAADQNQYYQTSAANRISKQLYSFRSPSEGQSKDVDIEYNTKINRAITVKQNLKYIFNQVNNNGGNGTQVVNNLIAGIGNAKGGVINGVNIANLLLNARPDNTNSPELISRLTEDSKTDAPIKWAGLAELPVATEVPKPIETQLPGLPAGAVAPEPGAEIPLQPSLAPTITPAPAPAGGPPGGGELPAGPPTGGEPPAPTTPASDGNCPDDAPDDAWDPNSPNYDPDCPPPLIDPGQTGCDPATDPTCPPAPPTPPSGGGAPPTPPSGGGAPPAPGTEPPIVGDPSARTAPTDPGAGATTGGLTDDDCPDGMVVSEDGLSCVCEEDLVPDPDGEGCIDPANLDTGGGATTQAVPSGGDPAARCNDDQFWDGEKCQDIEDNSGASSRSSGTPSDDDEIILESDPEDLEVEE
jgi:hypothetical protein